MRRPRERRWPGRVAAYAALLLALVGIATAFYVPAGEGQKPLVIRLAVAALAGVVMLHVHGRLRYGLERVRPSEFERALVVEPNPPKIDPLLLKLRDELRTSVKSRYYFERALWPRLLRLAERDGPTIPLQQPEPGWSHRRGPPLRRLAALIKQLGEKS